jgi:hypothetical protein
VHFREPSVNLGIGGATGRAPHLVGEHLLKAFGIKPGGIEAHAFTYLNFEKAAKTYGKVGGFAHLATLVKRLRAGRPTRCCSTAATPGRARPPPCGARAGHGRCLQAARRGHDGRHTGNSPSATSECSKSSRRT